MLPQRGEHRRYRTVAVRGGPRRVNAGIFQIAGSNMPRTIDLALSAEAVLDNPGRFAERARKRQEDTHCISAIEWNVQMPDTPERSNKCAFRKYRCNKRLIK